jgi:TRAP-type C4-dicarboxylate transport system permease large subunit
MANVSIEEFTREAIPFIACILIGLVLFIYFPQIVLWVPDLLMGESK